MFGEELLCLRDENNESDGLRHILKQFKVPVGVNDSEMSEIKEVFKSRKQASQSTMWGYLKSFIIEEKDETEKAADGMLNDHSRVIYLMAPDNKFLAFYNLNLTEKELATQIIEDCSYDIGT